MVTDEYERSESIRALDHNAGVKARNGWSVVDKRDGSCKVEIASGTLGTGNGALEVTTGTAITSGTATNVATQAVDIDEGDPDNPRKDVVSVDRTGTAQVHKGVAAPQDPTTVTLENAEQPAPPSLSGVDAVPLSMVTVPAGATEVTSGNLADKRERADREFGHVRSQSSTTEQINNEVVVDVSGNETLLEAVARLPSGGGVVNVPPAASNITVGTGVVDRPTVIRGPGFRDGAAVLEGQVEFDYAVDLGYDAVATALLAFSGVENVSIKPAAGETGLLWNGDTQPAFWNYERNVLVYGDGNGVEYSGQVTNHLSSNVLVHNVGGWGVEKDVSTGGSGNASNHVITKMRVRNAAGMGFNVVGPHSNLDIRNLSINQCGADADNASAKLTNINGLRWLSGNNEQNDGAIWLEGVTIGRLGQVNFRSNGGVGGITSSGANTAGNLLIDSRDTTSSTVHVTLDGYEAQDADAGYDVVIGSGVNTGSVREFTAPAQGTTAPSGRFSREADTLKLWQVVNQSATWSIPQRILLLNDDAGSTGILRYKDQGGTEHDVLRINRNTGGINGTTQFESWNEFAQDLTGNAGSRGDRGYHDGTDGTNVNAEGPAFHNGTDWISLVDGGTIA